MSTYAIGDIQGCFDELQELLKLICFDANKDSLWLTGDLVNRGPKSLEVLRFIKGLGTHAKMVIGNHDLFLLECSTGVAKCGPSDTIDDILRAPDKNELFDWLRHQPFIHYDKQLNFAIAHAGILPTWDLTKTLACAKELELALLGNNYQKLLAEIFGDQPNAWDDNLQSFERLRFISNSFTRMRFCDAQGRLEFNCKNKVGKQPKGYYPWFDLAWRKTKDVNIIFGHWAALDANIHLTNLFPLDTGCVFGGSLTALRLEDKKYFSVPAKKVYCPIEIN